jgi:hypothetical protein
VTSPGSLQALLRSRAPHATTGLDGLMPNINRLMLVVARVH